MLAGGALPGTQHSRYISQQIQKATGAVPGLVWLVPPDTAITTSRQEKIQIYSAEQRVLEAHYAGPLPKDKIPALQKEYTFLCPPLGEGFQAHTYKIQGTPVVEAFRAFYTVGTYEGSRILEWRVTPLPGKVQDTSLAALKPENTNPLHKSFAVTFPETRFFYSFHGLYHPGSEEMFLFATLFHGAGGEVLGSKTWTVGPDDPLCADCGTPTFDDSLEGFFAVQNGFSLPGFPHPLLFRDRSTLEGRIISLVTFDESGAYHEQHEYEYVVTCILGYDE